MYKKYNLLYRSHPNRKQFKSFCVENNIGHDIKQTFGTFKKLLGELNG